MSTSVPVALARWRRSLTRRKLATTLVWCAAYLPSGDGARAEDIQDGGRPSGSESGHDGTFIDHGAFRSIWLGGQVNGIFQAHPSFAAPYSGPNSLQPGRESALSGLLTIFFAIAPFRTTELIIDPEMSLGGGLSQSLGVAGFPNLDVVRNPTLSHAPYIARLEIHQVVPLCHQWIANQERGSLSTLAMVPLHRLDFRFGKMSTVDRFDVNPAGSDSHLQFMNWTVDNNGAFDYAADTRGYTYGFIAEYQGPRWEARFGVMLMPKVANGIDLNFDVVESRGENFEIEIKYGPADWRGEVRLLGYQNHANMGSYRDAIEAFINGTDAVPDVTIHRRQGRVKRGVGANLFQEMGGTARVFARVGWSDGNSESFAYTEVENTMEIGGDVVGGPWRRPTDRVGLAVVSNGISGVHSEYLRRGGSGFLLGDGGLSYARELIAELYYNLHVWRGAFLAQDAQVIDNPGYNSDRGPAWIFSTRAHLEF
jgi:high affinity Mn2+ porin